MSVTVRSAIRRHFLVAALVLGVFSVVGTVGCGNSGSSAAAVPLDPTFANVSQSVFAKSCALSVECHQSDHPTGNLQLDGQPGDIIGRLVGQGSFLEPMDILVVAGQPDSSLLYRKLTGDFDGLVCKSKSDPNGVDPTECGEQMPYRTSAVTSDQLRLVHDWIAAGATND